MDYIIHKIKRLQNEKNLTVPKFAEKIGLSKQAIYDIYKGKTAVSIKTLELFSNYFDVPMPYWFEEDTPDEAHEGKSNYIQLKKNESMKVLQKELDRKQEEIDRLWDQINFLNEQLLKAQGIENDKSKAV